ncbi:SPOR domain-containing protein [Crocosphaera chwakensis]|uniref:tRNA (5-methylaminomethyl-2-thiouridylate)-methyltransferase n=1 Tax=Crocosphaera chwakensis CCY0110 TaxID=391612 RepID=A3IKX6_9CHRO|nr:tRNA (5-methylaminomethyl-2-thiouridylate)-methyltransferase [Crocosphaera chwakensis]EAZ92845.1 tRNA (5-methylaminomethyl-2-thiouridylate)-methyltransferase [Crocosphaera chwakensis CCY0110]
MVYMMLKICDRLFIETVQPRTWFLSFLRQSSTGIGCLLLTLGSTSITLAQTTSNRELPPPPMPKMVSPQPSPEPAPTMSVEVTPASDSSTPVKEYTFEAPQTLPAQTLDNAPPTSRIETINNQSTENPSFYRVEVAGNNPSILSQVKTVEPMAFIRQSEGVIHAGMFQHSQQAEKRVQELKNQGVSATIVPVYQQTKTSLSVEIKP